MTKGSSMTIFLHSFAFILALHVREGERGREHVQIYTMHVCTCVKICVHVSLLIESSPLHAFITGRKEEDSWQLLVYQRPVHTVH